MKSAATSNSRVIFFAIFVLKNSLAISEKLILKSANVINEKYKIGKKGTQVVAKSRESKCDERILK